MLLLPQPFRRCCRCCCFWWFLAVLLAAEGDATAEAFLSPRSSPTPSTISSSGYRGGLFLRSPVTRSRALFASNNNNNNDDDDDDDDDSTPRSSPSSPPSSSSIITDPLYISDTDAFTGDFVILINNVLALDLYVISRRATRGEEGALRWLEHFLRHTGCTVNHASAMMLCWIVAGLAVRSWRASDSLPSEEGAVGLGAATWLLFTPLAAAFYAAGDSGLFLAQLGEASRYTPGNFGADIAFNGVFLVAWRLAYYRWRRTGGV
jgi:hypothetical protein